MVERKNGQETPGREERIGSRLQVVYARKTRDKQIFMQDLKEYRKCKAKQMLQNIINEVGPKWYQALSVLQTRALDSLEFYIYQDLLEARPHRTAMVMRELGIYPRPPHSELLHCIYKGRNDAKEMLAQLYLTMFGYPIEGKRTSYSLNAKLILSAILYLGLNNLIQLLKERFAPEASTQDSGPKRKPKKISPPISPYLQKMVATTYNPPRPQRLPPPPLPNLEDLNEPYEEVPCMPKPSPPPPPPPPPKKRLPRSYCDKLAGVMTIYPSPPPTSHVTPAKRSFRRTRSSKMSLGLDSNKKSYGLGLSIQKKGVRRRKPVAPTTGQSNTQHTINGVFQINGRSVYVLGNVTTLPTDAQYIHGGHACYNGEYINIHRGYRGWPPEKKPEGCDCLKKWHDTVFKYVKDTKCFCGHYYDYTNEGTFPPEELPYFIKPTRHTPMEFDYQTIFDIDNQRLHIQKEFKRIWDTDSVLHVDELDADGVPKVKPTDKKKKKKKSSKTCLGRNPKPVDYLKCALRLMRNVNIAAKLPDAHLVPELKEWMRFRLYGPFTFEEKKEFLRKSTTYWRMFNTLADKGFGHVSSPRDPLYRGLTTWTHKQNLNDKFKHYTHKYRLMMFRSHAYVTNLFWRSMYQAEFPDAKFREIYFSYLFGRIEDLNLLHPYSMRESTERMIILMKKRYICVPAGVESKE